MGIGIEFTAVDGGGDVLFVSRDGYWYEDERRSSPNANRKKCEEQGTSPPLSSIAAASVMRARKCAISAKPFNCSS